MARHDDLRRRLEALRLAVQRKAGPLGRLDDEQRAWLAEWRQQQRECDAPSSPEESYAAMIDNTDREIGEGLRNDIKHVLYGDIPQILKSDTEAQAADKWARYLDR